ncbi:MAG: BspA family leucine-rich repeat surface protein, partial [Ekhidna sp.]|nr:BspA family leucine-rich repeat surface protein [Ekhidna sp.]
MLFITFYGQAQTNPKPFITTWETTTPNETVTIPTVSGETYNYTVNWGDGSEMTTHTNATPPSHTYTSANTYTITISGTFPRIRFGKFNGAIDVTATTAAGQIRSVEKWGDIQWTSMKEAFAGCDNLTFNASDVPNLSNVTDMSFIFAKASFNGDLSKWDVSKVTNMVAMFFHSNFNGNINKWDVSSVTDMSYMFWISSFNGDISEWDISNMTRMQDMFRENTSMSSENYDKLLIGWSTLDEAAGETRIPPNISFWAPRHYTCKGEAARNKLIKDYSWKISLDSKRADAIDPTPDAMTLKAL